MKRPQRYSFGMGDSLLAEVGGVPLDALHWDVDAICRCYDAIVPVSERLGMPPPQPRLAGFAYSHVSALGAEVVFAPGSEPKPLPIIRRPEDIDKLREPKDYLSRGIVPKRLELMEQICARRPDALRFIGHKYEGPVTTAALLMGPDFFTLPYDDPKRAHALLSFCVRSAVNFARVLSERLESRVGPGPVGIPDDFAGMFPPSIFAEFVVPYWEEMYASQEATTRNLHSELLRKDHLPFLAELKISVFDPSADQYLTPKLLREHCPVPFTGRILSWEIHDNSAEALQRMYREIASYEPVSISFSMCALEEEKKIMALLEVARELAKEE